MNDLNSSQRARRALSSATSALLMSCAFLGAPTAANAALYFGNTAVSDGTLPANSIANANTSRHLAVGADGTIYAVYTNGASGIRVARSDTRGQSFQPSVSVTPNFGEAEIAVSSTGIIYVAWTEGVAPGSTVKAAFVSRSLDGGASFSAPVSLGTIAGNTVHMATDANYVYAVENMGNKVFTSSDSGQTFSAFALNAIQVYSDVHVDSETGDLIVQVDNPAVKYYISTDHGQTFSAQMQPTPAGNVYFSVGALSSGPNGRFLFVAGANQGGMSINLADGTSTTPAFGNNTSNQGRSLNADRCGNVVDGYVTASGVTFAVSNDLGATFGTPTAVSSATSANAFINPTNGDVLFLYDNGGQIYLNTYYGELGNCYNPEVSASSLVYGGNLVGQTSTAKTVTISNTGAADVQIQSITATGDFAQTSGCVGTLAVGQSCDISVTFTPTALGTRSGQLEIQTNVFTLPRVVNLTGEAVQNSPVSSFDMESLAFVVAAPGTSSDLTTVVLTNRGDQSLTINGFAISGPFSYTTTCGASLAVAAQCTVDITYTATSVASSFYENGKFSIDSNALGAPASISLRGSLVGGPTPPTPQGSGNSSSGGSSSNNGGSGDTGNNSSTNNSSGNTTSTTNSATYTDPELTSGNDSSAFGGGAFGGFALGALALVALRRRSAALAGAAMIATAGVACAEDAANDNGAATAAPVVTEAAAPATNVESAPAQPAVAAKESRWYVGANFGSAVTDAKSSDVTAAMNNSGITGTASVSHASRNGWKLFGGYHFNDLLAAEFGYTNLGQITTRYSGTSGLTLSQLIDISPASGKGIEIAAVAKMPINERYTALARVGVWHWQAEYRLNSGSGSVARPSGENGIGGFAIDAAIKDGWNARVAWDIYTILGTTTHLYSVGVTKALNF